MTLTEQSQAQTGPPASRVIAITSGKGGVGKTNLAVNLGIALAQSGRRTVLWDMDLGLANADVLLGLRVRANLGDVLAGRSGLNDILTEAPGGLQVVPGASGDEDLANLDDSGRRALLHALEGAAREADYLLIDTGAGISDNVTRFTTTADDVIVVTTPEPTALLDAFASIKLISHRNPDAGIHLLVNMARSRKEARHAMLSLLSVADRFIHKHLEEEAYLPYDEGVSKAVRRRQPFILSAPESPVSQAVWQVAHRLIESEWELRTHPRHHGEARPGFVQRLLERLVGG